MAWTWLRRSGCSQMSRTPKAMTLTLASRHRESQSEQHVWLIDITTGIPSSTPSTTAISSPKTLTLMFPYPHHHHPPPSAHCHDSSLSPTPPRTSSPSPTTQPPYPSPPSRSYYSTNQYPVSP